MASGGRYFATLMRFGRRGHGRGGAWEPPSGLPSPAVKRP
jgi:hypothetical protein